MEKAFGWLGDFFQYLLKLIPVIVVIPVTSGAVLFSFGKYVREWKPGVHWYWPLVSFYKMVNVVRQTVQVQPRLSTTRDAQTVMVGGVITYEVSDVVAAASRFADFFTDVIDRTLPVLLGLVATMTIDEINADRDAFNVRLTNGARKTLEGYGVNILQVQLTELGQCRVLNHTGHMALGQYTIWTEFSR